MTYLGSGISYVSPVILVPRNPISPLSRFMDMVTINTSIENILCGKKKLYGEKTNMKITWVGMTIYEARMWCTYKRELNFKPCKNNYCIRIVLILRNDLWIINMNNYCGNYNI
jgi:hypothetical protein